jgi:hypothetical protein
MKNISMIAVASAVALSAIAFIAAPEKANAGLIVPPGHYCLTYDIGGSDCSFTSYAQCQATASGIDGECYGDTLRDDQASSRSHSWAGEYQTREF